MTCRSPGFLSMLGWPSRLLFGMAPGLIPDFPFKFPALFTNVSFI